MPRISDIFTDNAVYIYSTLEDAQDGVKHGGSGFLVHVPFEINKKWRQVYVITNQHVIEKAETPVLRMNKRLGGVEFLETKPEHWQVHADGDDIAAIPVKIDPGAMKFISLPVDKFVTPELVAAEDIGIGDDTIMVGRFISHDGKQQNTPSVRFGNIAMMVGDPIECEGRQQESFLVEMRSLPGASGSAVHIYSPTAMFDMSRRRAGKELIPDDKFDLFGPNGDDSIDSMNRKSLPKGPFLLGIDWCHLQKRTPVMRAGQRTEMYVEENAGMAGVVPAWKIIELLNQEYFVTARKKADADITKRNQESHASMDYEYMRRTQKTPEGEEIPIPSESEFLDGLEKATRKITPDKK